MGGPCYPIWGLAVDEGGGGCSRTYHKLLLIFLEGRRARKIMDIKGQNYLKFTWCKCNARTARQKFYNVFNYIYLLSFIL